MIRYWIEPTKSSSVMAPSAHQPALVLTHSGTAGPPAAPCAAGPPAEGIPMTPASIRYPTPPRKSESVMAPSAHQPAFALTHSGTPPGPACAAGAASMATARAAAATTAAARIGVRVANV